MSIDADILLTNSILLSMDEHLNIYEPGALAVHGSNIIAVGYESDLRKQVSAREIIDCKGKVLMPGLVNAHTHVPMTLLRGLADDLRLDVWLLGYMMPVEREFVCPDFVTLGTRIACAESIRSGVTCFADMYYYENDVARATADCGLRAVCSQTVLKFPSPDADFYEESLAAAREFIIEWKGHELIVPSIAPHAPYTCTEEILHATAAIALEFDVPLHTHIAETMIEVENSRKDHGMAVVPYAEKHGLLNTKLIAAHCVHLEDAEIQTLRSHNAGIAHNPSSNLKLSSGYAQVHKMVSKGINVGIGTDGPASNNDLDMFEEIRLASFLAKSVSGDPTTLPAAKTLEMATRLGAKALHLGDITGSLQTGKRADLILVDLTSLHNTPRFRHDPKHIYAQIIYSTKASDVTDVMVNGEWLMRNQNLLGIDEEELSKQASEYARRIDTFIIQREESILSKLLAIGGAKEEESFEVQVKARVSDLASFLEAIKGNEIELLYHRHYHEFDTYFIFEDPEQGLLRYREDEFIDENIQVTDVRYRLTLIGPTREYQLPSEVLLSRSRYIAPAVHSLRFYREYFNPLKEVFIEKDRLRWRVLFQGTEFYINLDRVDQPDLGSFLEVKSRTWSRRDAENKALIAVNLIEYLSASSEKRLVKDYIELVLDVKK